MGSDMAPPSLPRSPSHRARDNQGSPGQVAGAAEPALFLLAHEATELAGEEAAFHALAPGCVMQLIGLQAAGTVCLVQVGRI